MSLSVLSGARTARTNVPIRIRMLVKKPKLHRKCMLPRSSTSRSYFEVNANEVQMNLNSPAAQAMCNTAAGADVRDCGFLYLSDRINHMQIMRTSKRILYLFLFIFFFLFLFLVLFLFLFLYLSDTLGVPQAHLSALNLEVDLSLCIVAP